MEKSSFFNAILDSGGNPDRVYLAEDFAQFFSTFIGNGVFTNPSTQCQVVAIDNNMTIRIKSGFAWINGYMYQNTGDYIFDLDPADGVLNRIDRVVLRLDFLERKIKAVVKKGDYASNAIAKELQRDNDAYELALADIKVNKGAIKITQADITDLRQNSNYCGIVHGTVDQVDVTTLFNQYSKALELKEQGFETEFTTWFNNIKGQLSGDVATNLAVQIDDLKTGKVNYTDLTPIVTTGTASDYIATIPTNMTEVTIVPHINNLEGATLNGINILDREGKPIGKYTLKANIPSKLVRVGNSFFLASGGEKQSGIVGVKTNKVINFGSNSWYYGLRMVSDNLLLIRERNSPYRYGVYNTLDDSKTFPTFPVGFENIVASRSIYHNKRVYYLTPAGLMFIYDNNFNLLHTVNLGSVISSYLPFFDDENGFAYCIASDKSLKEWDGTNVNTYPMSILPDTTLQKNYSFVRGDYLYKLDYNTNPAILRKYSYKGTPSLVASLNYLDNSYFTQRKLIYIGDNKAIIFLGKPKDTYNSNMVKFCLVDLEKMETLFITEEFIVEGTDLMLDSYELGSLIMCTGAYPKIHNYLHKQDVNVDKKIVTPTIMSNLELQGNSGSNILKTICNDKYATCVDSGTSFQTFAYINEFIKI